MEEDFLHLYNQKLIAMAAETETPRRLGAGKLEAKAISPICGSEVTVNLSVKNEKVVEFGYEVEACALTRAVVAVMKKAILGKTRAEIAAVGDELRNMLEQGTPPPKGEWSSLEILVPVREYRARHNAILLPFEAVEKAFKKMKV